MYVNLGVCISKLQKHMFPANGIGGGGGEILFLALQVCIRSNYVKWSGFAGEKWLKISNFI